MVCAYTKLNAPQNTHLDRTQLSLCVSLIENGVNPEALAVRIPTLLDQCTYDPTLETLADDTMLGSNPRATTSGKAGR